jgi:hypothetical protein
MPQHHNIEEARATWKACRTAAFKWWRECDYRGPYNGTPPLPPIEDYFSTAGPPDPMSNIYPFVIERTPWRNGSREWYTYIVKWDDNVIEHGTM